MTVVDAQIHLWLPETSVRPWLPAGKSFAHGPSFTDAQAIAAMDGAGVDMAVLAPPSWEGDRADYCIEVARTRPDRFLSLGRLPVSDEAAGRHVLASWPSGDVCGVRLTFARGAAARWLTDGTCEWLWPLLTELELPAFVYAPGQLSEVGEIVRRYRGLRVVVDHLGLASNATISDVATVVDDLERLSELADVAVKASCVQSAASDPYPFESMHAPVRRVVAAFGADRVFWGSDLTRLPCVYADSLRMVTEELDLTEAEVRGVAGDSLLSWLRLT